MKTWNTGMLARLAAGAYDRPLPYVVAALTILGLGVWALLRLSTLEVGMEGLIGLRSEPYREYQRYTKIFGNDETFMVVVSAERLMTPELLRQLSELHRAIGRKLPNADRLASLINTPLVRREGDTVVFATALQPWPASEAELLQRIDSLAQTAPHHLSLLSPDRRSTLILVTLKPTPDPVTGALKKLGPPQYRGILDELTAIVAPFNRNGMDARVLGQAAYLGLVYELLLRDLYLLPAAALGASILLLLLIFQRRSAVLIPALIIVPPVVATMSLIGISGLPIQVPVALLPPALVVVGIATCVHILASFYEHYTRDGDKRAALIHAFEHKASAIWMTTLTTMLGMISYATATLGPIIYLGIFGAVGTMLVLLSIALFVPIYVRWVPLRPLPHGRHRIGGIFERPLDTLLDGCARLAAAHPLKLSTLALAATLVCSVAAMRLPIAHQPANWLPQQWPISEATRIADPQFRSSLSIEILLDSGAKGQVAQPAFIDTLSKLQSAIVGLPDDILPHGLVLSVNDYLRQMRAAVDDGPPADAAVSGHQLKRELRALQLVAPELARTVVSSDQRHARITVRLPLRDAADYRAAVERIEAQAQAIVAAPFTVTVTGQVPILVKTHAELAGSARASYLTSFLTILAMMVLHMRSLRDGLVAMLPNVLPIVVALAAMHWLNMALDMLTMLVVSISMGLVVDDTIHFSEHFRRHFAATGSAESAVRMALQEAGRAMIVTTTVLALGWQMLILSQFEKITLFGTLTASIMALGMIAELLVTPALMIWNYRNRQPAAPASAADATPRPDPTQAPLLADTPQASQ